MHWVDYGLIALYAIAILFLGLRGRLKGRSSASELIIGGRLLTLPAFVASLVSTWYGGILGVGEYSYRHGLSNWLVFGVPYYLAAFGFALFLAKRAREAEVLTIPDRLAQAYDKRTALAGSVIIYLMTVPAAYILMLGVLCEYLFGWPFWAAILIGTILSTVYVYAGGFRSLVRIDLIQFAFMFLGFILLVIILYSRYGGLEYLRLSLPSTHFTWHGGKSGWYVATWYFIALATFVEPAFHQRCYAARNASVARNGILISIVCWALFDFLTTTSGLYARAILPTLSDPVASYPALARQVLPVGVAGLFALAMLSTVTSTIDSYLLISASTFGNDIVGRLFPSNEERVIRWTRVGVVTSVLLAVGLGLFFRSVIEIWQVFGSIGTPALLIPVVSAFVGRRRLPPPYALLSILSSGGLSLVWFVSQYLTSGGDYWLGIQPIFPGLICSILLFGLFARSSLRTDRRLM
ncbi:MAG TPA: sodium:solute symporter family protein [Candidatus Deferrimicrobium sp.]|nr:sodium:solute symporter family protein [Candidatus Deferrimicrobium sp.]